MKSTSLRLLLFNIAYGTGPLRGPYHNIVSAYRYLRSDRHHIEDICEYVEELAPDIAGLVEVERGSVRNGRQDQVALIARALSHHFSYDCKYGRNSFYRLLPILGQQGNVVLAKEAPVHQDQHFFPVGTKRLVMEAHVLGLRIILVHLAVTRRVRRRQIKMLHSIIGEPGEQPTILAGDFNVFGGAAELAELMAYTGLRTLNEGHVATYPAYAPRKELDFVLCSPHVGVNGFWVDTSCCLSDHLPLIADLEVMA